MTVTTTIRWTANGLDLSTYAWNVATFGGRRYTPAVKRGEDLVIPFSDGRVSMRKFRESSLLTLSMWILPLNEDGTRDTSMSLEQKLHSNWNTILSRFDTVGQFILTKRWWDGTSAMEASTEAETVGGFEPSVEGQYKLNFDVELLLADPFFYAPLTAYVALGPPGTPWFTAGTVPTSRVEIQIASPSTVIFSDGNWISYSNPNAANVATVNLHTKTAAVGATYVNGFIQRNPRFPNWPTLDPGGATAVSSGAANLRYQPAYR